MRPVRIDAGAHRELQRRPAFAVSRLDRGAALEQELQRRGPGAPGSDVKRRGAAGDVPVPVGLWKGRVHGSAEVEQQADALGVADARELAEQLASVRHDLLDERRLARRQRPDLRLLPPGAGGDEPERARKDHRKAARLEQLENVAAAKARRHRQAREALPFDVRIGALVEQPLDERQRVVAQQGLVDRALAPAAHAVRVGAVVEQVGNALVVVPVVLADQHHDQAVGGQLSGLDE